MKIRKSNDIFVLISIFLKRDLTQHNMKIKKLKKKKDLEKKEKDSLSEKNSQLQVEVNRLIEDSAKLRKKMTEMEM